MEYTDGTHGGVLKVDDRPKLYTEFHDRPDRIEGGDGVLGARTVACTAGNGVFSRWRNGGFMLKFESVLSR